MKVMKALPDTGPTVHVIQHPMQIRAVLVLKKSPFIARLNKKKASSQVRA